MQAFVFAFYWLATRTLGSLPLPLAFGLGKVLGLLAWALAPGYRNLVKQNLHIAFGKEWDQAKINRTGREHFALLGANLLSSVRLARMNPASILKRAEIVCEQPMQDAEGNALPMIGLVMHQSCWEALAQLFPSIHPGPCATVYQRIGNKYIDADVAKSRGRIGLGLLERRRGIVSAMRMLREGAGVAVLVDQNAGTSGVWVPFFNRLVSSSPLAPLLARRSGARLMPVWVKTVGWARWRIEILPPLSAEGGDEQVAARINAAAEDLIRRAPADWFWVHDRWKEPKTLFLGHPSSMPENEQVEAFSIAVRSPNWLGDAVMCVPTVRALKNSRPDLRLIILTPEKLRGLWEKVAEVDAIVGIPNKNRLSAAVKALKESGPHQAIFLLPNSLRTALESFLAGIPRRIGHSGHLREKLLTTRVPQPSRLTPPRHQVEQYLDLARCCGVETAERSIRSARLSPVADDKRIILCPGAEYGPAKRWPVERFAKVAELVNQSRPSTWYIVGVPKEKELGRELAEIIGETALNQVGATSLGELLDLVAGAACVVSNDTGTMHLATLLGTPVVAVFGSTEPRLTGPLGDQHQVIRRHVACSPCFLRECPLDFRCMLEISPERVAAAVLKTLASGKTL